MAKLRFVAEGAFAAVLVFGFAGVALSQQTGVQILGDRQKAMRDMQAPNGFFQLQVRAANPDWATVIAQTAVVKSKLEYSKGAFPPHTKSGGDVAGAHVKAKEALWTEWDRVAAMFDQAIEATGRIKTAAEAQDKEALATAVRALGATCSDCHARYRE